MGFLLTAHEQPYITFTFYLHMQCRADNMSYCTESDKPELD